MGTIQNAFNQMLGVVAGGISSAKLLHNQERVKKQNALNLAETQEEKAKQFNEDVKAYEKEVNQNISDLELERNKTVATYREFGVDSKQGQLARKAYQEASDRYNQKVEELTGQKEGLEIRKQILGERKAFAEKDLGKNSLSHIKLSDVKSPSEQNEIKAKAVKSAKARTYGGKR